MPQIKNQLCLNFNADTDGTGELFAQVQSNGFAGQSSAWFGSDELIQFSQRLINTFPIPHDDPLKIEGGFWSKTGAPILQLHVGLSIYPIGHRGLIGCHVKLATPINRENRPQEQSTITVELQTHYEQIRAFGRSLEILVNGTIKEAILYAEN